MKIQLVIIGIVSILIIVGLSAWVDSGNNAANINREKILGRWTSTIPNTSLIVIMNFFSNESFYEDINETNLLWGKYSMTSKMITMQYGNVINRHEYSFLNNNTLLLEYTSNDEEIDLVFTKQ